MTTLDPIGVGVTYTAALEPLILAHPELFDTLEIEPQTLWLEDRRGGTRYRVDPRVMEHVAILPGRKLIHSIGTPVGGSVRPDPSQLALLGDTIRQFGAPWVSDHLSFNATSEFNTGFFLPPRQTEAGVQTVVRAIADLQRTLPAPVAVETGVNYLRRRPDEMDDGEFVAEVVTRADCGLLLDLHNVFANSVNGRQPIEEYLAQLPLERVWEIHLAGGMELDGYWLDAHSGAIPDPLIELTRKLLPALPNLRAIIFEIFPSFVEVAGLDVIRQQLERLRRLWDDRSIQPQAHPHRFVASQSATDASHVSRGANVMPEAWERALGSLVIGGRDSSDTAKELSSDPGVSVVTRLIREFRASMIVGVLRMTSRLMMLSLGADVFRVILNDFWQTNPPQQFAASEAAAFARYLLIKDFKIPLLAKVLEFEQAVMSTVVDQQTRVVHFDNDPLPMFRALAEGRLPDVFGQSGAFEIEVTPDGPAHSIGLDSTAVKRQFPFH